jgi:Fic family protein
MAAWRLLITLLLCHAGLLRQPLLYLSLYFKQHRTTYYDLLNNVRRTGDWEARLAFFLEGVKLTSEGAVSTAQRLSRMFQIDRNGIEQAGGRKAGSPLRVHDALKSQPTLSLPAARRKTNLSFQAASSAMELLISQGIAREITGKRRGRLFVYDQYLSIVNEGT